LAVSGTWTVDADGGNGDPQVARGCSTLAPRRHYGSAAALRDCSDEIQIQFFHLNQISGSSAEITISTKAH